MSYVDLLSTENIKSNYLMVLRPKIQLKTYTLFSGAVYSVPFNLGPTISMAELGVALTLGTSSSLSAGQFYHDTLANILYVRLSGGGNPNSTVLVGVYEIYVGTLDAHWYSNPTNSSTSTVYFNPLVKQSPQIKTTQAQTLFGFMPTQSSQIVLLNAEHTLEPFLYSSSFSQAEILMYHWLGESLDTTNISLVFDGFMSDLNYKSNEVSIKVLSFANVLDDEFRNPSGDNFFSSSTFPNIQPNSIARPIRSVYGRVDGFALTNIDWTSGTPTTSNNRNWVAVNGQTGISELVLNVVSGSTTTVTKLASVSGLDVLDTVILQGANTYYVVITAVDRILNTITHAAVGVALLAGAVAKRGNVSRVDIFNGRDKFTAMYGRDYTCANFANGSSGITFNSGMEASVGFSGALSGTEVVSARVYGRVSDVTLSASLFGTDNSITGNMSTQAQIILDIMKRCMGISESKINSASFVAALSILEPIGLAIPANSTDNFPTYKNLLLRILQTGLFRLLVDGNNNFTLSIIAPMGNTDITMVTADEAIDFSFSHTFTYTNMLSDIILNFAPFEVSPDPSQQDVTNQVIASSNTAKYLHGVVKSQTFESLHILRTDAQILANRLSYIFGDAEGVISVSTKNRFFQSKIGDIIEIDRAATPGFTYDGITVYARKAVMISTDKSIEKVVLGISDNKGIEDNKLSW